MKTARLFGFNIKKLIFKMTGLKPPCSLAKNGMGNVHTVAVQPLRRRRREI